MSAPNPNGWVHGFAHIGKDRDGMRECTGCKQTLPVADFYKYSKFERTFSRCKKCCKGQARRAWWRKRSPEVRHRRRLQSRKTNLRIKFGLSWEQFSAMIAAQNGCCAICKNSIDFEAKKAYGVDHDHVSGKVRAILCTTCNLGLGSFQDDPELLTAAANYLRLHRGGSDVKSQ